MTDPWDWDELTSRKLRNPLKIHHFDGNLQERGVHKYVSFLEGLPIQSPCKSRIVKSKRKQQLFKMVGGNGQLSGSRAF